MPLLTRWYIKASFVYLLAAFGLGLWLAAAPGLSLPTVGISPLFFHFFLVGWVTQLIFGIAYWMLPKFSRQRPHRSETLARAVFVLLNTGLLLRGLAEPRITADGSSFCAWTLLLSALLQWLACLGFVVNTWARVKER